MEVLRAIIIAGIVTTVTVKLGDALRVAYHLVLRWYYNIRLFFIDDDVRPAVSPEPEHLSIDRPFSDCDGDCFDCHHYSIDCRGDDFSYLLYEEDDDEYWSEKGY